MKVFSPFLNGTTTTSGSFNVPNHPSTASIQNPLTGSLFHDDTDGILKIYTGTQWQVVGQQTAPSAGPASADIEYLLVAGGGSGGQNEGGGGGGGGLLSSSLASVTSGSSFTVTIGGGGSPVSSTGAGNDGTNSSIAGDSITTITATAGGGGGYWQNFNGRDGGSGGGGGAHTGTGGSGTSGQGFDGGDGNSSSTLYAGAGGGGASSAGSQSSNSTGGNGGDGKQSNITGTMTYYAGGGGGGTTVSGGTQGTGGQGGATNGGNVTVGHPSDATSNTGGGGGGNGNGVTGNSGAGGSGVAIFAYPTSSLSGLGGIKTTRSDGYMVHTFNSSGTLTIAGTGEYPFANGSVFAPVIYTGNGGTQSITSLNFQPDLVWVKSRSATTSHMIIDSIRGANEIIFSNLTNVETNSTIDFTSFDSNGFSVGSGGSVNASGGSFVAWCWKAGGAAVSNTDGNVTTTVSANPAAGFSIVKYFGGNISNTYGHGLDLAPELIIIKNLDTVRDWSVVGTALGGDGGDRLVLNDTVAKITTTGLSGTTATTFAFEHNNSIANSAENFIAYCFHSVSGYQKIGTYTGNGSTTGPIVTLGFRPRFIIVKATSIADNWTIWDNVRETGDDIDQILVPNNNGAESADGFGRYDITLSSTGFQIKRTDGQINSNGQTYLYLAIA